MVRFVKSIRDISKNNIDIYLREIPEPLPPVWRILIPKEIKMTASPLSAIELDEPTIEEYILCKTETMQSFYLLKRYTAMQSMIKMEKALKDFENAFSIWHKEAFEELEATSTEGYYAYPSPSFQDNVNIPGYFNSLSKSVEDSKDRFQKRKRVY